MSPGPGSGKTGLALYDEGVASDRALPYEEQVARYFAKQIQELTNRPPSMLSDWPLVRVDGVEVARTGDEAIMIVTFRHAGRPGCVFGWRGEALPEDDDGADLSPELWADILVANLGEEIEAEDRGLPTECSRDGAITWLRDQC
jgi:hypothetical protein